MKASPGQSNFDSLLLLANSKFENLTISEERLFRATASGEIADYRSKNAEDDDPGNSGAWSSDRILKADRIVWLCTNPEAAGLVTYQGIQVSGARIDGDLSLLFAKIPFPISFNLCAFPSKVDLCGTEVPRLSFAGSHLVALDACGLKVERDILLRDGFRSVGAVRLTDSRIGEILDCTRAKFSNVGAAALQADRMKVGSSIFFRNGFEAESEVSLISVVVGGTFHCDGGSFLNRGGDALSADGIKIEGDAFLRYGFRANGDVRFIGASIRGNLECQKGKFANPGADALSADGVKVGGDVYLREGFVAEGEVRFLGASIDGNFECQAGHFTNPATDANPDADALSAEGAKIEGDVYLCDNFKVEGKVCLRGLSIGGNLECQKGQFNNPAATALSANGMKVEHDVYMRGGFEAIGAVWLMGSDIGGDLECQGGKFLNGGKDALQANRLNVEGIVCFGAGFVASGTVSLVGGKIGGNLNCDGGVFENEKAEALNLEGLECGGSVFLRSGFTAKGEVRLHGARIVRSLECSGGRFIHPGETALNGEFLTVQTNALFRKGFAAEGDVSFFLASIGGILDWTEVSCTEQTSLDLRYCKVGVLRDDKKSWPAVGKLSLSGFVYATLYEHSPSDPDDRIDWLKRQDSSKFFPQPYEHLAGLMRKEGRNEDAIKLLIAKNLDQAARVRPLSGPWWWLCVFGKMIGYGYRPWRAFWISLVFIAFGWLLFGWGYSRDLITPTKPEAYSPNQGDHLVDTYPKFNAFIYSLEAFTPILNLYQKDNWRPNANHGAGIIALPSGSLRTGSLLRGYLWFHIIIGWVLTSLWVGGITGLVKT